MIETKIFVISTPNDPVRELNVTNQFANQSLQWPYEKIPAIMNSVAPRIGIMRSFKKCIQMAKERDLGWVLILEDDFDCLVPEALHMVLDLWDHSEWYSSDEPFLFMGGVYEGEIKRLTKFTASVEGKLSGLHCMVVPAVLYDTLLAAEEPYQLDYWISMVAKIPVRTVYPFLVLQKDGFSYNAGKITTYTENLHLKYDLFKNPKK